MSNRPRTTLIKAECRRCKSYLLDELRYAYDTTDPEHFGEFYDMMQESLLNIIHEAEKIEEGKQ